MTETRRRLQDCFLTVFPDLTPEQACAATPENVEGWDSVAAISLAAVVGEEFDVSFGPDDLRHLTSYQKILDCLHGKGVAD